jgi:hypothetical protein
MAELATNQLIKIILGILVFVAIVGGAYLLFKGRIIDFFDNLVPSNSTKMFLGLIKC